MVTEEVIVRVSEKGVTKLKTLLNLQTDLEAVKKGGGNVDRSLTRVNKRINKLTGGAKGVALQFRRFKFEMLGVLFFGMAMTRFMKGLLKPALDVAGAFDVINFILQSFFIETASTVTEKLLELNDVLEEMPDFVKELFGDLLLLIGLFGVGLTLTGIFSLGISSLATALGTSVGAVALFTGGLFGIVVILLFLAKVMKDWENINEKTKIGIGLVTGAVGILAVALGSTILAPVLLLSAALILLRLNFDKIKELAEPEVIATNPLGRFFESAIEKSFQLIKNLFKIRDLMSATRIGVTEFNPTATSADVIAASEGTAAGSTEQGFKTSQSFFDITINTTNGIDEVSLKDELKNFINETNATGVANVFRR